MARLIEATAGVAKAKIDLIKWMVGTMIVNLLSVAGLIVTLIKTIPK